MHGTFRPLLLLTALLLGTFTGSGAVDLLPFATKNQSPFVQIYGLPPALEGRILEQGRSSAVASVDIASHFTSSRLDGEEISLDGETYRATLALRHGIGRDLEVGLALPWVMHRPGFLDGFIVGWHDFFSLPQNGRDESPRDDLLFFHARDGEEPFSLDEGTEGFGDLSLSAGWQLLRGTEPERAVALRATLKLPTGDSDRLLGSGSTDLALWLSADRHWRPRGHHLSLFGSAGLMGMTDGEVLPAQQRNLVAFGSLGGGWAPWRTLGFKVQLDGHSAFYDSRTRRLKESVQLILGGTWAVTERTSLDLGVSEDILVDTAPDVVFHLALRHDF